MQVETDERTAARPLQRHPRREVRIPVSVSTIDAEIDRESGKRFFRSSEERFANLSRGGAFVTTAEPVAPGRRLLLEFELPDGATIEAIARVAWSRTRIGGRAERPGAQSGIGVEFVGSDCAEWRALERFLGEPAKARRRTRSPTPPQRSPNPPGA